MKLVPDLAGVRADKTIMEHVSAAADDLIVKLRALDLSKLGISDYIQKYLGSELATPQQEMTINVYMLSALLTRAGRKPSELTFVDYGGGAGTISCLAKAAGIGTVVYLDIYDVSCRDSCTVGKAISCAADHYVNGELPTLVEYMRQHGLSCDILGSHNCIEHVYDVPAFLRRVKELGKGRMTVWFSSGANPCSGRARRRLMRYQVVRDQQGRAFRKGDKLRDTPRSFQDVRRELVAKYGPDLPADAKEKLATLTRGLWEPLIKQAVEEYAATGKLPPEPSHPTNTCDPYTGNWCEQLMDPFELGDVLRQDGYQTEVLPGFFGRSGGRILRNTMAAGANAAISCLGNRCGMSLAPYYILLGTRTGPQA